MSITFGSSLSPVRPVVFGQASAKRALAFGASKIDSVSFSGSAAAQQQVEITVDGEVHEELTNAFTTVLNAKPEHRNEKVTAFNKLVQKLRGKPFAFPENLDLHRKNLKDLNLTKAIFKGQSNLEGVNLFNATLTGAIFSADTNLKFADLRHAKMRKATLSGCDLTEAKLQGAFLRRANLQDAQLLRAYLEKTCLVQADLSRANLTGADLKDVDLSDATLTHANNIWKVGPFGQHQYYAYAVWRPKTTPLESDCLMITAPQFWGPLAKFETRINQQYPETNAQNREKRGINMLLKNLQQIETAIKTRQKVPGATEYARPLIAD